MSDVEKKEEEKIVEEEKHLLSSIKKVNKGFWSGFKKFISKGNIIDLAIAVVIGAAFTAITSSLVNDIIMPLIASFINLSSFADLKITLNGTDIFIGKFIMAIFNFLIIAFFMYSIINVIIRNKQFVASLDPKEEKIKEDPQVTLLREIKELLEKKGNEQ
jgi:large conductance mechanosensitive channel